MTPALKAELAALAAIHAPRFRAELEHVGPVGPAIAALMARALIEQSRYARRAAPRLLPWSRADDVEWMAFPRWGTPCEAMAARDPVRP